MNFHCCLLSHFFLNSAANYDELQWSSAKVYERNNIPQTSRSQRSQAKRFKQEGKRASRTYIHQGILTCSCLMCSTNLICFSHIHFQGKRERTAHNKPVKERRSQKARVLDSDEAFASSSAMAGSASMSSAINDVEHEAWMQRQRERNQELERTLQLTKEIYELEKARNTL